MSWRAFYDMLNPDGDYNTFPFHEARNGIRLSKRRPFQWSAEVKKPVLSVYGDGDEFVNDVSACVSVFAEAVGPNYDFAILEDADHGFGGREEELAELMIAWLARDDR